MNKPKFTLQTQKYVASLLHLFFLILTFVGIGLMYLNDNYGAGITKVQSVPYEDTQQFSKHFNKDLNDIFNYMEYNTVFATDGSVDVNKTMLQMTFGPNETETFNLGSIIEYLQSLGYELNDNFEYRGTPDPSLVSKSPMGYVEWSASTPHQIQTGLRSDLRRVSLEEISLEIMDALKRYYSTHTRLMAGPSNLHFKIEYTSPDLKRTTYTNDPSLSADVMTEYGRYAYLQGNSVFYDTNFKTIALNTISSLAANNPYEGNTYYMLATIDTNYPNPDSYQKDWREYRLMQSNYYTGLVFIILGVFMSALTLIFLMSASGHNSRNDKTIRLHSFDKISPEIGVFIFALLTLFSLGICRFSMVRIAHLIMAEDTWALTERVLYTAVLYLGALLLFFSLLRRYKARVLWSGSLIYKGMEKFSIFFKSQNFSMGLVIGFLAYLAVNTALISMVWIFPNTLYVDAVTVKILIGVVIVVWIILNLWIFYILFRRSVAQDKICSAVERLAAGETSYQVDLDDFEGKEWDLAVNINNISAGLESALQEKMKSERLKADLITNVSHDIKTPLTSIINYVDLIKREHLQDEKILRYLDVLEQKSQRLKTLTEDLVEASKASSGNLKLEVSDIDLIELIYQTNGEFEEKFASRHLELVTNAPDETLIIEADGRRLWRVLENLYNNAFKYAVEGSRIYVDITKEGTALIEGGSVTPAMVVFTLKNVSAKPLNIRPEELTERFVRGDVARTTEGSGLGLSIAKSLTELQNGRFDIVIDGDLFKASVAFNIKNMVGSK